MERNIIFLIIFIIILIFYLLKYIPSQIFIILVLFFGLYFFNAFFPILDYVNNLNIFDSSPLYNVYIFMYRFFYSIPFFVLCYFLLIMNQLINHKEEILEYLLLGLWVLLMFICNRISY